jgi:iduronate 2-sulfatase
MIWKTVLFLIIIMCPSAHAKVKNILLIVSDDLKADALGCYGSKVAQTPNIDELAREGMLFQNAYCQGTVCRPSRASFMRGRYHGGKEITWGEHFQKNGYSSTRVGKIFHMRVPGDIIAGTDGDDVSACWSAKYNMPGKEAHTPGNYACLNLNKFTTELKGRQSTKMPYRMFVTVDYIGNGSDQPDWKAATKSVELLKTFQKDDKPFFLATGLVRPHYPNVAPEQYFARYPFKQMKLPLVPGGDWDDMPKAGISSSNSKKYGIDKFPDNQKRMWAGYLATVTFMDEQVGRILKTLKELGLDKDTAVFFTSDHGYLLGEHHFWQKGNLREEVTRVPLVMRSPGRQPGVSSSIVELVDMFPTACELIGLPIPKSVQGKSLLSILDNPKATVKSSALSFVSKGTSMRSPNWAYMKYGDGSEELYDMKNDPKQFKNLAKGSALKKELQTQRKLFENRNKAL